MRVLSRTLAAAGATGVLLLAGPAFAAGPYTVTVGSVTSGLVPYTATAGAVSAKTSRGVGVNCSSGSSTGTIKAGVSADGKGLATISSTTFNNCIGPLGLKLNLIQTKPWKLNGTGPVGAVIAGNISGIAATIKDANGQCSFTVTGTAKGSFNQSQQSVNALGSALTLKIANVQGCFGQVVNGDKASLQGSFVTKTTKGLIKVT